MKTIIHGPVTAKDLEDAGLFAGIYPTMLLTNGVHPLHASLRGKLPVETFPPCPKQPVETAELACDYTLAQTGEALVIKGVNPHLVKLVRQYELPVYEV